MTYDVTELPGASSSLITTDLSHDLRTPLAIIRMQAQLMIRLTLRGAYGEGNARERLMTGLQRIDDAAVKLNDALERIGIDRKPEPIAAREIY